MAEKCISSIKESIASDLLISSNESNIAAANRLKTYAHISTTATALSNFDDSTSLDANTITVATTRTGRITEKCAIEEEKGEEPVDCEKVDIFLETPVVDDNNKLLSTETANKYSIEKSSTKPKRLSDEFFSADDGEYDNEEFKSSVTFIKYDADNMNEIKLDKSSPPNANLHTCANIPRFEENSTDNLIIGSAFIEDEISSCSNLIDINNEHDESSPHSSASPTIIGLQDDGEEANHGDEHNIDNIFYSNDVQSMDTIERIDFQNEQKLTGGIVLRSSSLVSGDNRLNIGLLNTFSQKLDKDRRPDDNDSQSNEKNGLATTPTSSRTKIVRFGSVKSAAKLNLSANIEKLSDKSNNESEYVYNRNKLGNNNSTLGESSVSSSSRNKLLPQAQFDDFLNSNSNDSLSSDKSCRTNNFSNKCCNHLESTASTSKTPINSDCASNCCSKTTIERIAVASTSKTIQDSGSSSNCQFTNQNCDSIMDCSNDVCPKSIDKSVPRIKEEKITIEDSANLDSNSKQQQNFEIHDLPASSSSSLRSSHANHDPRIDDSNFNRSHVLNALETHHDFEEDTWADCEEGSDVEEVCTCRDYSDEDAHGSSEDELPSRDVDLSCYTHLDTISDDILQDGGTETPRAYRKRKLTETRTHYADGAYTDTTPVPRKRLTLDGITSPKLPCTPSTPPTLTLTSPTSVINLGLSEKRMPRMLIPTRDNPPPELNDWLLQFQRWSHAERLLAVDRLIEHCEPTQVRHMMKVIEPQFQRDFISLLPKELALQVLSFLEPKDLLRAAQTCRSWRFLCDDNLLWKEKSKQSGIIIESTTDRPKRGRAGNMPPISSPWKAAYMRQHIIELNWRSRPIRDPKILKGHDDHVITCLQFCGNRIVSGSDDNTLKVWSAITGKCLRTLVGHTGGVWSSQMSGNIIISGSTDRTLKVWNADSGHCTHTLYGHTSTVRCMHLHGNKVVSGSRDATLRVWDIIQGKCLHILVGHLAAVRCVQYDGKLVISGAYDYMVKVWNPERQECLHTLQGHTNRVYSLQFDGIHVVSGSLDTSIRVWDAETGSCKHTLMGHQSLTSGMELRQNILVSGNADSTVKVWDITNGQCLQTLSGSNKHQSAVTCLQFNSRFVITSSDDGTVKLWDVRTGEFIRNLVALDSGGSGGVVWRIRANDTKLICAVGSRNGTEETKLMVLDFDVEGACLKCS